MTGNPIRLAIADDHTAFRQAMRNSLSAFPDFLFLFEASNGRELLDKLAQTQPDVLLLDMQMPDISGLEALSVIHQKYCEVRPLILSAFADEIYVAQCLDRGVNGYLTKTMDLDEIIAAIKTASRNEVYYTNLLSNSLFRNYLRQMKKSEASLLPIFSSEEMTILQLLSEEKSTEEISSLLNLSKRSIELKRDRMRQKANVKTTAGLLLYAHKRGLSNMTK